MANEDDIVFTGDVVQFTRFGHGVGVDLVGCLGVLIDAREEKRSIWTLEGERALRYCVRVRAENGETVGARLSQLESWCNTGAPLAEVIMHLRTTERGYEKQGRELGEAAARAKQMTDQLIEKLTRRGE